MTIKKEVNGNTVILYLEGKMDYQNTPILSQALNELDENTELLILDLSKVDYITSVGLRLLVLTYKQMHGAMILRNLTPEVKSILEMTGFYKQFHIE